MQLWHDKCNIYGNTLTKGIKTMTNRNKAIQKIYLLDTVDKYTGYCQVYYLFGSGLVADNDVLAAAQNMFTNMQDFKNDMAANSITFEIEEI